MSNVTKKRRMSTYYQDIKPKRVFGSAFIVAVIILAVAFFFTCIAYLTTTSLEEAEQYSQMAEKINHFPQHEREIMNELITEYTTLEWDNESMELEPKEASWLAYPENFAFLMRILLIIAIALFFALLVLEYWLDCSKCYYLADFPLGTVYGWILLMFCLPFGWPFLVVSFKRMRRDLSKTKKMEQPEDSDESIAEDSENEEVPDSNGESEDEDDEDDEDDGYDDDEDDEDDGYDDDEIDPADFESDGVEFPFDGPPELKANEEQCVEVMSKILDYQRDTKIENIKSEIACYQARITTFGKSIQEHQDEISKLNAKETQIAQLMGYECNSSDGRQWTLDTLNYIMGMRGVREITLDTDTNELKILIRVWVPYRKVLYDFGDYQIILGEFSGFRGRLVRSGTKDGSDPLYPDSTDGFCFGERRGTICDYIAEGRVIEALTLIVDSLHSVNDMGDARAIPDIYSRVDGKEWDEE